MNKFVRLRFNEILTSIEYQISFLLFTIAININYLLNILNNINSHKLLSITAFDSFFSNIQNMFHGYFFHIFFYVFIIISTSTLYLKDNSTKLKLSILTRSGRNNYYIGNLFVVFISSFILIFVPLFLNYLISLISNDLSIPITLRDNIFFDTFDKNKLLLKNIYLSSPYLLNLLYTIIPSFFAALWAVLFYSISLVIDNIKLYILPILSLLLTIILSIIFEITGNKNLVISRYLYPKSGLTIDLSINFLGCLMVVLLIISVLLILAKIFFKRDELWS